MRVCVCMRSHARTRAHLCLSLCNCMDCSPTGSFVHGDFPDKNTGVGCRALLQGIFPTQGWTQVSCMQVDSLTSEPPGKFTKWDSISLQGIFRWHSGKESASQCRRLKRIRFDPCVGKIPWSREWQLDQLFLPGKFHGPRSLAGLPMGLQRVGYHWAHTYPK